MPTKGHVLLCFPKQPAGILFLVDEGKRQRVLLVLVSTYLVCQAISLRVRSLLAVVRLVAILMSARGKAEGLNGYHALFVDAFCMVHLARCPWGEIRPWRVSGRGGATQECVATVFTMYCNSEVYKADCARRFVSCLIRQVRRVKI